VVTAPASDRTGHLEGLGIGELGARTGVAASALRFYEAEGLITSTRTGGGQRRYARDTLRRVSFVRIAQQVGLSLGEIRAALASLPDHRTPTRRDWERLSSSWRPMLDQRIRLLERLRDGLAGCIGCGCLSLTTCPLYNPDDVLAANGPGPRILLGDR
jgi:MerR family redox-sensitive transcriptional activator SoxR